MKKWRIEDSEELYNIKGWGVNYFGINEKGHVYVSPKKNSVQVDLKELVEQLESRHVAAPMLLCLMLWVLLRNPKRKKR